MSGWRLTLKQRPALRVDARALQPSVLAAISKSEIERIAGMRCRWPSGSTCRPSTATGS